MSDSVAPNLSLAASSGSILAQPATGPGHWLLDEKVAFLNHGSFGSCPRHVLDFQSALRDRLERQPVEFLVRDLEPLMDDARAQVALFLGASPDDLVFVPNATAGVNTILRSMRFEPGDELLVTDHEYNACRNALNFAAESTGAKVVVAKIPFPFQDEEQLLAPVIQSVTSRTRLALLDHVSSQTALVFPIAKLVSALQSRGVDVLVDGAHAPGMVPLDLNALNAAYYTGNCHKWLCAPKGAGFLHVRKDRQPRIRPLSISHGANTTRKDRSFFQIEFGWTGTADPTPWLSVPEAIRFMGSLLPGRWPAVMQHNRQLALAARDVLCAALDITKPCPDEFIGSLAAVPLPDSTEKNPSASPLYSDPMQDRLRLEDGIEVPIIPWPSPPKRILRVSAQLYNSLPQYEALGAAVKRLIRD